MYGEDEVQDGKMSSKNVGYLRRLQYERLHIEVVPVVRNDPDM